VTGGYSKTPPLLVSISTSRAPQRGSAGMSTSPPPGWRNCASTQRSTWHSRAEASAWAASTADAKYRCRASPSVMGTLRLRGRMPVSQRLLDQGITSISTAMGRRVPLERKHPSARRSAQPVRGERRPRIRTCGAPRSCLDRPGRGRVFPSQTLSLGVKDSLGGKRRNVQWPGHVERRDEARRPIVVVGHSSVLPRGCFSPAATALIKSEL
jgi:hypothetical protein